MVRADRRLPTPPAARLARLHFSESERAEIDVVLERRDGGVFGIEVKLTDHIVLPIPALWGLSA